MDNKNQTTILKIKMTSTKTAITIITNTAIMKTIKRTTKRNLKKLGKPARTTIPKKKLTMVTRMRQLTQLTRNPQNKRIAIVSLTIVPPKNNHRRMKSPMMRMLT